MSRDIFKNTINELNNLKSYQYKVDVPVDKEGYIDKECPNKDCLYQFKIYADDWKDLCKDDAIYCPKCGKNETSDKWFTTEQVHQARDNAIANVRNRIGNALKMDAKTFNRYNSKGFLKMNMKVTGFNNYFEIPLNCKELLIQKKQCRYCNTRYAVVGSAFYCPCCGKNSAIESFEEFINTTSAILKNIRTIRNAIENKDEAERIIRNLIEKIPNDLVEAIEVLSEEVYNTLPNKKELKKNIFQRIDDSDVLWKEAIDKSFDNWLTQDEIKNMRKYYQQRHLLIHRNGIVDEEYLKKTNDLNYKVGERIIFNETNAIEFTNIIQKLGKEISSIVNKG